MNNSSPLLDSNMSKITSQDMLDLLPIVAHQEWTNHVALDGAVQYIRNEKDQCPICALVDELSDGKVSLTSDWIRATEEWFGDNTIGRDLYQLTLAADLHHMNPDMRQKLMDALEMT